MYIYIYKAFFSFLYPLVKPGSCPPISPIFIMVYSPVSLLEIPPIFHLCLSHLGGFLFFRFSLKIRKTRPHNKESYDFMAGGRQHRAFIGPTIGRLMARWIQIRRVSRRPPHNFFILPRRSFVCTGAVLVPTADVTPAFHRFPVEISSDSGLNEFRGRKIGEGGGR